MVSGIIRIIIAIVALVGILGLGTTIPIWLACSVGFCIGTAIGYGLKQIFDATAESKSW